MLKKKKIILIIMCLSLILIPRKINALTISDFEKDVNKYTAELQEKQSKVAKNDAEVAEIKKNIASIENQIAAAQKEIETLQVEIEQSNEEIIKKSDESKRIMAYYQIENGDNAYLEYAFGAETITDMIYRMSIVEQLTAYNDQVMKELKQLIEENNKKKASLATKKEELASLRNQLQSEKERIDADTAALKETMPSVQQQIDSAKANLNYFKKLGCGATEDIYSCQYRIQQSSGGSSIPSTNGFFRPMEFGYLTQNYAGVYKDKYGNTIIGHLGVDLSSSNKTIPIYPISRGQLFFAGYDDAGALIVVLKHNYNNGYIYSTYAHLSSFSSVVSKYVIQESRYNSKYRSKSIVDGPIIDANTSIGNMGSTGNSTGPHLHLEITKCQWRESGGCSSYYGDYIYKTIRPSSLFNLPSRWTNR